MTSYVYDAYGNIVQTTNPDGTFILTGFNAKGQKVSETNQLGDMRTFEYDSQGRLTKVVMPKAKPADLSNPVYEYAYDARGNQTSIKDPLNRVTTFTYDSRGNQLTRTLPMGQTTPTGQVETFEYDDLGRQTLHISFEGVHVKSEYNAFGRLAAKKFYTNATNYAAGTIAETWSYKFDVFGRETEVFQAWPSMRNWTTTTTYTPQGRIASLAQAFGTTSYLYDEFGRQKSVTLNTGEKTSYTYDAQGRLATVKDVENQITTYGYDAFGNRAKTTLPNGVITTYTYDVMNRLLVEEAKLGATLVSRFEYEYDALGQKELATETHRIGSVDKPIVAEWEYDALGRVTKETLTHHDALQSKTQTWTYDLAGNRTKQICGTQTTNYTYNANDQLTKEQLTDTADSTKNRLTNYTCAAAYTTRSQCYRGSSATTANQELRKDFAYGHDGRLYSTILRHYNTSGVFYFREFVRTFYDATGTALRTDHYTNPVDDGNYTVQYRSYFTQDRRNPTGYTQAMRERYNSTGLNGANIVPLRSHSHTFGHECVSEKVTIAAQPNAPQTYFFVHDGLANTRCLTNNLGAAVERYNYDAYGNAIGFVPANALTQYLYCSERFDAKLGWTYLRARYYDPRVGRFNRLDPFFGNLSDPQSLHKYTYCHGDPINFTDPSGMAIFITELGKAAHKLISEQYRLSHIGHYVTYDKVFSGGGLLRPDIMNFTKAQIGEIKPCSAYGFATGPTQLWAAINIANTIPVPHFRPGGGSWKPEDWDPGVQILYPGTIDPWFSNHLIITLGNLNGLIFYKAVHIPVKVLPFLVTYMLADKIAEIAKDIMRDMRFGFDPVLEPIYNYRFELLLASIALTGVAAWGVATRNTVETARGNTMMAISSLLSMRVGSLGLC